MAFSLFSRCPISIYAEVETLILLFRNLLGHTFCTECISDSLNDESGPETIADERPKPNILLILGLIDRLCLSDQSFSTYIKSKIGVFSFFWEGGHPVVFMLSAYCDES